MGFWVFLALVLAALALRRALTLEKSVRDLRGEIVTLQARLAQMVASAPVGETISTDVDAVDPALDPATAAAYGAAQVADPAFPSEPSRPDASVPEMPGVHPQPGVTSQPAVPPLTSPAPEDDSLERRIGTRWLLYLGVGALVLGISYFVKYAFDNEWIAPPVRVALGLLAGLGLVAAGQYFIGRGFIDRGLARYGQTLSGGGVGVLYLTIFAAYDWYALLGRPVALAAMIAITLGGVWLADRQRSQVLALFAITIGFLTPFLIGGDPGAHIALFSYDLVLVAGTLLLARRRDWPALNIVSFLATMMTVSSWAEQHYHRSLYVSTELFLTAFLVLFLFVLRENRRSTSPIALLGTVLLASSPILYHLASLSVLGPHRGPFLVYLIGASVAGVIAAQHLRTAWLRVAVWTGVAIPFLGFASERLGRGWQVAAWVTLAAIYGVHVIAQAQSLDDDRPALRVPEVLLLHANGLWALMALWLLLAPRAIDRLPPVALGLAVLYLCLAAAARHWHREAALHAVALAATLGAAAAAIHFSGPWAALALAVEGTALVWLGLRADRHWMRHAGSAFLSASVLALVLLFARQLSIGARPFFNQRALAAAIVIGLLYTAAWLTRRMAKPLGSLGFTIGRLVIVANVLTLLVLSAEVSAYFGWSVWDGQASRGAAAMTSAELARQLSLSIVWAAYAVALIAVGLRLDYRPIRILAISLFALTIAKVFFVDLAELDRVYRMLSVMGLGVLLLTASYLYQRLRVQAEPTQPVVTPSEGPSA